MNTIEYRIWNAFAGVMEPWENIVKLNKIHLLAEQSLKYPVMQFIGVKDENGTKIFEGDTVVVQYGEGEPTEHVVVWGGVDYPAFDLMPSLDCEMNGFAHIYHDDDTSIRVVGHIYK